MYTYYTLLVTIWLSSIAISAMTRSRSRSPRGIPETPPGFWDIDGLTPPPSPRQSAAVRAAVAAGDQRALAIAINAAIDRAILSNAMLAARAAAAGGC